MQKITVFVALFMSLVVSTSVANSIAFNEIESKAAWDAALDKAKNTNTLLFVDLYTDWCGYCKKMDREVFSKPEVGQYFNEAFINVKLDGESQFGAEIAASSQIEGYPSYIFFDGDGNKIDMITGFNAADVFMTQSKSIKEDWQAFDTSELAFKEGKLEGKELEAYLEGLVKRQKDQEAMLIATEAFEKLTTEQKLLTENQFLLLHAGKDLQGMAFQFVEENLGKLDSVFLPVFVESAYQHNLLKAIEKNDQELLTMVNEKVIPIYAQNEDELTQGHFITNKMFYAARNEWESYGKLVKSFTDESGDLSVLYDEAYQVFESYQQVEAFQMALGWLDDLLAQEQTFEVYALKAYALGMMMDYASALDAANSALEVASSEEQKNSANEIITLINKAQKEK